MVCIGLHSKVRNAQVMEDYDSRRRLIKKAWEGTEVLVNQTARAGTKAPLSKTARERTSTPSSGERQIAFDDEYTNDEDVFSMLWSRTDKMLQKWKGCVRK